MSSSARESDTDRAGALEATARLLASLARAGARHHDLNAKNVLLTGDTAVVLDVDRVALGGKPDSVFERNLARLARSLRKWRDRFGAAIAEDDIARLERLRSVAGQIRSRNSVSRSLEERPHLVPFAGIRDA